MNLLQNWIFLAILAGLASNAYNFSSRYILKDREDPITYAWHIEIVKFILFASIAILDWKIIINSRSIILFILLGITEVTAIYGYMKMHFYTHLSISTILYRTRLIWTPILAFLLLGENLKLPEYIGILILLMGLSIVISPKKIFLDKGANYANLAAFSVALNTVVLKMALPFGSVSVLSAVMILPSLFALPLFINHSGKKIELKQFTNLSYKFISALFNVVSLYLLTFALRIGDASKITGVYQGMLIFSVLAGIMFLKERENIGKKLIGTTIILIGVLLLTST